MHPVEFSESLSVCWLQPDYSHINIIHQSADSKPVIIVLVSRKFHGEVNSALASLINASPWCQLCCKLVQETTTPDYPPRVHSFWTGENFLLFHSVLHIYHTCGRPIASLSFHLPNHASLICVSKIIRDLPLHLCIVISSISEDCLLLLIPSVFTVIWME